MDEVGDVPAKGIPHADRLRMPPDFRARLARACVYGNVGDAELSLQRTFVRAGGEFELAGYRFGVIVLLILAERRSPKALVRPDNQHSPRIL
jgi:hypothetical protein